MGAPNAALRPERAAQPSPALFFETMNAFQRSAALRAAIELDLFTAVAEGAIRPDTLARKVHASERGTRILCDYLTVIGFLNKRDGAYGLTQDSAVFLDRRSPAYVGGATRFLHSDMILEACRDLTAVVRQGTAANGKESVQPDSSVWVDFARGMAPIAKIAADWIANYTARIPTSPLRVLDIAAGHGLFGVLVAARRQDAHITAVDWANVLQVASENARAFGVSDRHELKPGSAFDVDFGTGYDVVLITNFLHHFDVPTCETLLRKVYSSLKPGGCAITLEFIPNEDRVTPPISAAFSLMMLTVTPAGDAYTFAELKRMFENTGFHGLELHSAPPVEQRVVVARR